MNKKILVLGDIHLPWCDWRALEQAAEFNKKYKADLVITVGDLTDQKTWSKFGRETDDPGNNEEWTQVLEAANKLHKLFPKMTILIGNHDIRYLKSAKVAGIPSAMLRTLEEMLAYKGWKWHTEDDPLVYDGMSFLHGDEHPGTVEQKASMLGMPVIQGHTHKARIVYVSTPYKNLWGLDCGCLVDPKSPAARYAAKSLRKTFVGFATITNGIPHLHPKK